MQGRQPINGLSGVLSREQSRRDTTIEPSSVALDTNDALTAALRAFRRNQVEQSGAPAYTVFSDKVLHAIVANKPHDQASFLSIKGLGQTKWQKYGTAILAEIARFEVDGAQ